MPAALLPSGSAQAFNSPEEYVAADDSAKVRFLITLARGGQHEDAARILGDYPLQGPLAENRTLFVEGLILRGRGDLTGATKKFRAALANDPKLTLVRAELAKTLVTLDQDDSAKHHLELLVADAPDAKEAGAIRSFIDQVDAKRPFTINGYVSLAPSSNLNNGSSHEKIYLPFGGQQVAFNTAAPESGLGVAAGGNAAFTKRLGNKLLGVVAGGVTAKIYKDDDYNSISTSQSAELRFITDDGYMGFGAIGSQSFGTDTVKPNYVSYGPRVSAYSAFSPSDNMQTSVTFEWRNYENDLQDGWALLTDSSWTHAIDSSFNVSLLGGFNYVNAERESFGYKSGTIGAAFYKELPQGITLNGQAIYMLTKFNDVHNIIPKVRKDDRGTGMISLTKRDFDILGLAPSLSYTYTRNFSNIDLYDFDNHAVDFKLTKKF